jgi:hypothetical protein
MGPPLTDEAPVLTLRTDPRSGAVRAEGPPSYSQGYRLPGDWDGVAEGVWAEWSWDGRELVARNDRLGFSPMFWFANGGCAGVSPSLAALLPHLPSHELDDDAISVFLRYRSYIGEDTPFRLVRALPAGATLRWSGGRAELTALGPVHFSPEPGSRRRRQPEYVRTVAAAIGRALASCPGRVALPLTGGLDSRLLLYSMLDLGRAPDLCLTVHQLPPRDDGDVEFARDLAGEVGVEHRELEQPPDRLAQQLRNLRRTHLCTHEHDFYIPVPDYLRRQGYEAFLDGIGGDLQAEPNYITQGQNRLMDAGRVEEAAASALGEKYLPAALPQDLHQRWSRDRAIAHLAGHALPFQGDADPWGRFRFHSRTRRNVALLTWSLHQGGAVGLAPFLDRSVVELLGPIPWQELADRTFRVQVLADAWPHRRERPRSGADFSSVHGWRALLAYGRSVMRWAGSRAWRSPYLRPSFLPPRLLRAHVDQKAARELPSVCEVPVYLLELERWLAACSPGRS